MKLHHAGVLALTAFLLLGCPIRTEHKVETTHKIEAHIVIDVRKVQQEAGQIESEVRGADEAPKAEPDPGGRAGAMLARPESYRVASPRRSFWSIFDLSTSAHAAESDENAAIARRKERTSRVQEALTSGCLGENNSGYVELRPCDQLEEADEKARLQVLAEDENRDRRIIYAAIAGRQGLESEQAADAVGAVYAGEIRKLLTSGQAFQTPTDDRLYEEFIESELGRRLGKPKPGVWVEAP